MKFSVVAIQLALALATSAASLKARSVFSTRADAALNCPGAEVVESHIIQVGDNSVTFETFACGSAAAEKRSPFGFPPFFFPVPERMRNRSAGECTNAQECQCGQLVTLGCQNITTNGPNPNDCNVLLDATTVLVQESGATFFVKPQTFNLISFQSCGISYTNTFFQTEEYCWNELASFSSLINQECFDTNVGTAGLISANNRKFTIQLLNVGS